MANKKLFKSLIGKLMPVTDALNEERAPAYKLSPQHLLAQYAATGCLNELSTRVRTTSSRQCSSSARTLTRSSSRRLLCSVANVVT